MGKSLNGKELGKGITQRKDGLFQARFTNRFGKRQTIYAKTYTEITKKLRDCQYEDERQLNVVDSDMTLDEWFEIWLRDYKKNCRNTTLANYEVNYKRIKGELGWRKLSSLNSTILQQVFNNLKTDRSRADSKEVLVDMLKKAQEADLIQKNPACYICTNITHDISTNVNVLTEREIKLIYEDCRNRSFYPLIVVALNTGMRIGEICGLTWDCVDFEQNLIHVRQTLCYPVIDGKHRFEFHPPKTSAGNRDIPMTKEVRDVLLQQYKVCQKLSEEIPPLLGFENIVFVNRNNHPRCTKDLDITIRGMVNRINRTYPNDPIEMFSFHCLRHTFATNCINQGMRPKTLQKILGHSSLQMTMDLYCHVPTDTIRDEMAEIFEMV